MCRWFNQSSPALWCFFGSLLLSWGLGIRGWHFVACNGGVWMIAISTFRLGLEVEQLADSEKVNENPTVRPGG